MSTASTRRLSSPDGGRSSFIKTLAMCLLTAFSETKSPGKPPRHSTALRPLSSAPLHTGG